MTQAPYSDELGAVSPKYRVSIDIGGTFTDFVAVDLGTGRTSTGKVPSTTSNLAVGVLAGLEHLIPDVSDVEFIVHGTTVGLNAFLERKGSRVLLLMTAGLRDSYSIARGDRKELFALQYSKPQRLVQRRDVHEVDERLKWDGSVFKPLDHDSLHPVIEKVRAEGIEAVAVCLIHSYVNPQHELEVRDTLLRECPGLNVTLSHELTREWREYERASTAVLSAYIGPKVESYLSGLERDLEAAGLRVPLHVMQSSGGVMTSATRGRPINTLLSGPVGGAIGGASLSRSMGRNLLCVDMGGTSFEVSLIVDGRPSVSGETELEGLPVLTHLVDTHTIGAGGGSIAWLEAGGLRVGPQSAGADPGPACYGRGGTQPTVTDANLFLKRLDPGSFLGGRLALDERAAQRALEALARELGIAPAALAEGILAIVNARMADAIRTLTIEQGVDPREYSLLAYGGAGPMHAAWLARELEIPEVIIPWSPGTFSAFGMLQTDVRHDLAQAFYGPLAELEEGTVVGRYVELEREGKGILSDERVPLESMEFVRTADMRYVGQEYSVLVDVGNEIVLSELEASFHRAHETRYGHSTPDAPVEFVTLRVAALAHVKENTPSLDAPEAGDPVVGERPVVFDGEPQSTPILLRARLLPGHEYHGPAVIDEETATTVLPPRCVAQVDRLGNIMVALPGHRGST